MRVRSDNGVGLTERAVFIDANHSLFAIVTEPTDRSIGPDTSGHAIVLLNTGATNRMGPNRMYVDWARLWAARGYVVLRLDLAGLGDSESAPGEEANQVYPPGAVYDISVAIEFLRRRRGIRDVTLAGVCAGAYHALHSARAGLPVKTLLMINPLTFYWKQGSQLGDLQISEVVRNPGVYSENARSLKKWHKLVSGNVNLKRVAMVFVRRAWMTLDSVGRNVCRSLGIQIANDLGWDLQDVAARGVRMVFLFARFDGGHELLKIQGGSVPQRLGDRCRVHVIENADHIFTQRRARAQLLNLLSQELTLG
jgi:pimeloyl-ACP methyl ester carboxylesterase